MFKEGLDICCRSEAVCRTMLECGAVPHLVNMLGNEHMVMRNEAILALTTICATHMPRAETLLVDAKVYSMYQIQSLQFSLWFVRTLFKK